MMADLMIQLDLSDSSNVDVVAAAVVAVVAAGTDIDSRDHRKRFGLVAADSWLVCCGIGVCQKFLARRQLCFGCSGADRFADSWCGIEMLLLWPAIGVGIFRSCKSVRLCNNKECTR